VAGPISKRRHASILLPTLEDDQALFGDHNAESCAARWHELGVGEVVVKLGSEGAYVSSDGRGIRVRPAEVFEARDTTGAGDSFNAGYLSARLGGHLPEEAAQRGNMLAGVVVRHAGAIIPKLAMPLQSGGLAR
jgi:2-dehydro-3-deoxygluconokinase